MTRHSADPACGAEGEGPACDATLVGQAKAGDNEAFGTLLLRHERMVLAIARAFFAFEADAVDAAQEAALKAFERLKALREPARFASWLAAIVANTCRDTLRSKTDKVSLAEFSSSVQLRDRLGREQLTPAGVASTREHVERVKVAIGRLPEPLRVVVVLRYMEHMTYERIAGYLELPVSTVRGRLARAKAALREALQTCAPLPGESSRPADGTTQAR